MTKQTRTATTCAPPAPGATLPDLAAGLAVPDPDACPECGCAVAAHEGGRLRFPWCPRTLTAEHHRELYGFGRWPHVYLIRAHDGTEAPFCRQAVRGDERWSRYESDGRRTIKLPARTAFVGRASCSPRGETATVDPAVGLVLAAAAAPEPKPPALPFAALRAAHRAAFYGQRRKVARRVDGLPKWDADRWAKAWRAQTRPLSPVQLSTLIDRYASCGADLSGIQHLRYRLDLSDWDAAAEPLRATHQAFARHAFSIRFGADLPCPKHSKCRAREGGVAVLRALHLRGLLAGKDEITPEGRALVERALPVLAVCAFLVRAGMSWTTITRLAA